MEAGWTKGKRFWLCSYFECGADGDEQFERVYADLWHGIQPFDKRALGFL